MLAGKKIGDTTYKVHLDGYNNVAHWLGLSENSARREILYYDETDLMAIRGDGPRQSVVPWSGLLAPVRLFEEGQRET